MPNIYRRDILSKLRPEKKMPSKSAEKELINKIKEIDINKLSIKVFLRNLILFDLIDIENDCLIVKNINDEIVQVLNHSLNE